MHSVCVKEQITFIIFTNAVKHCIRFTKDLCMMYMWDLKCSMLFEGMVIQVIYITALVKDMVIFILARWNVGGKARG